MGFSSSPAGIFRFATRYLVSVFAVAAALLSAAPALAQGTMGALPDPISQRELQGYADRLGLSEQQRQAIEPIHDLYREEFRVLRETQIEKYVQNSRGWQGGGFGMMNNQDEAEKNLRELENILSKIKAIDTRFFDQIQSVLTEEQVLLMPSARQARERARYRTGLSRMTGFMNPATQVDFSEIIADLKLTPDERQTVAPVLSQYESSLTASARKLHDSAINSTLEMLEKLKAQGVNESTTRDEGRRSEAWDKFRAIMSESNLALMEKASEVSDINRKAARTLTPMLSSENSRALRDQYYQRGYPEAASRGSSTSRAFQTAVKFEDLTDEQRQTIAAMASEFEAAADRITEQMIDMIDENRKKQSFFDFDMDRRRKHEEQLRELRDKRSSVSETALDSLKSALGPDLTAKLEQRVAEAPKESGAQDITMVRVGPGGPGATAMVAEVRQEGAPSEELPGVDRFVPGPITKRDVDSFAESLKLSSDDKGVLASLYDNYIAEFKRLEENQIKSVREAQQKLWAFNRGAGEVAPPGSEAIDELYALRRAALQAIMALDKSFFEDIRITLLNDEGLPQAQRIEQSRLRQIYARAVDENAGRGGGPGQRFGRTIGQSAESPIDLTAVTRELTLTPTDTAAFQTAMSEYEQTITDSFAKMYDSAMRMQQGMDKFFAQAASREREAGDNGEGRARRFEMGGDGMRQVMEGDGRAAREARQAVTSQNRASLEKIKTLLPEAQAQELQRTYNRKAFASVYRDTRSAERHLTAALALEDLTSQQRTQVQEITAEFQSNYDAISEKLVELEASRQDMSATPENRDWRGMGDQMRNREKLQFDRNDVNDKAVSKLRAALTEEQIARLGGLEIAEESAGNRSRMFR
jgi:hypothetical protein